MRPPRLSRSRRREVARAEQVGMGHARIGRVDSRVGVSYDSRVPAAQFRVRVLENRALGGRYFRLTCASEAPNPVAGARPGQFVMLRGDWGRDPTGGRALSVLEAIDERRFALLVKVLGRGTDLLSRAREGESLTCTGVLGTGFPAADERATQLLVAGGVGLPPLMFQAREAAARGFAGQVELFYGGRAGEDIVLRDELGQLGVSVVLATEDGSVGVRGRITVPFLARLVALRGQGRNVSVLACGPTPMLDAVRVMGLDAGVATYLSLEERMACGIGACLGCAVPVYGPRPYEYCCEQGPVFEARRVRW